MQNNICISEVKLNAQKVFISHEFMRRDICAAGQLNWVIDNALLKVTPESTRL